MAQDIGRATCGLCEGSDEKYNLFVCEDIFCPFDGYLCVYCVLLNPSGDEEVQRYRCKYCWTKKRMAKIIKEKKKSN
jgi:hypothetical protein